MENEEELKKEKGIGADEIDTKKSVEDYETERVLKTKEKIIDFINQEETKECIRKSYLQAKLRLDKDIQSKILDEDIEKLVNGEDIKDREEIIKLKKERINMLQEENEDLKQNISKVIDKDMDETSILLNKLKREILISLVFGLPGVLFIAMKDNYDKNIVEGKLAEAVTEYMNSKDTDKMKSAEKIFIEKFGKINNASKLMNNIKSSADLILKKDGELKELAKECEEQIKKYNDNINSVLDDVEKYKIDNEIEEDEEDPEPVEGMKFTI